MHAENSALAGEKMATITGGETDRQDNKLKISKGMEKTLNSLKYCYSRNNPHFPHYFNLKHLPLYKPLQPPPLPIVFRARKKFNLFQSINCIKKPILI